MAMMTMTDNCYLEHLKPAIEKGLLKKSPIFLLTLSPPDVPEVPITELLFVNETVEPLFILVTELLECDEVTLVPEKFGPSMTVLECSFEVGMRSDAFITRKLLLEFKVSLELCSRTRRVSYFLDSAYISRFHRSICY